MELLDSLFGLEGRLAFVTGAGSGIGRAIAEGFARAGARVVCADVHRDRIEEVVAAIAGAGGAAEGRQVDIASETSVAKAMEEVGPRLDVLVNAAGISAAPVRTHELSVADWRQLIDVNLTGTFLVTRSALPKMFAHGGSIINFSSITGIGGYYPGFPSLGADYVASKAGIIGFTKQVAVEYAAENIRANAIAPGLHAGTRLGENRKAKATAADEDRFYTEFLRRIPMNRKGEAREILGLALYLASPASSYVTGQVIAQDGGWTAS